jgi:phosphatidylglycerol:prolipoprotein diacylglycerol transferase
MAHHYIHDINPIVLQLWGDLAVRWYGISYLLALGTAVLFLRHWSRRGELEIPQAEVANFIVLLGIGGVFLGGRLGYVLLYGFDAFLQDPRYLYRVWEGGMSSHGGFIGVVLVTAWYARKHGHSFWNLADHLACVASLGFFFGRLANFVNGELWGRVSNAAWAMYFPQELGYHYGSYDLPAIRAAIADGTLLPRHPSQLYQAVCEGLLLFGIMLLLRRTSFVKRPGALSACYLALYALARIAMEFFREPDNGAFLIGGLSKGQFYSLLMIVAAGIIAWRKRLCTR